MRDKKDRLQDIQAQLDVLMEEVQRLRASIKDEGRRRTYPFPFEPAAVNERSTSESSESEGVTPTS